MELIINDSQKLGGIQKQFSAFFPYLKLEFFARPHEDLKASPKRERLDPELSLKECRKLHKEGAIVIRPEKKVSELEWEFQELYGLSVQVFRRGQNVWLETTRTDHRTLKEQNAEAAEIGLEAVADRYPKEENTDRRS